MLDSLIQLFDKGLDALDHEVSSFINDENLWLKANGVTNSSGNLCLHICGNLQHFIGAALGKTGYNRNREAEFSNHGLTIPEMQKVIKVTRHVVTTTLTELHDTDLRKVYPTEFREEGFTIEYFLLHLIAHLNYHLGQINYLRRMIDKSNS